MKKIFLALVIVFMMTQMAGLAKAVEDISFIQYPPDGETLMGVDGNTSLWSSSNSTANLGVSQWSLLGGSAWVTAYSGSDPGILTHRGTRGLGIWDTTEGSFDEIDNIDALERMEISFDQAYFLYNLEVRSLFYEIDGGAPYAEQGVVDFYLGGSNFYSQPLVGTEPDGSNGIAAYSFAVPKIVDQLVFYVPTGETYSSNSEFAVAKLNVNAVPEPFSAMLYLIGGISLAACGYRRRRKT